MRFLRRLFRRPRPAPAGVRVVDMDPVIAMLDPDVSPFTSMLMKLAKRIDPWTAYQPSWVEQMREARAETEYWTDWDAIIEPSRPTIKVRLEPWLEDELFPRVSG